MTLANNPARPGAATREDCEVKAAGTLVYGVPYGDRRHYDFSMRLPTMGDNVDALEAHPDASGVRIDLAMFAACMERLGDIPADDIAYELLAEIDPADMDVIYAELAKAKKKAAAAEQRLRAYRKITLILGRYGIPEQRVRSLTLAQVNGFLEALAELNGAAREPGASSTRRIVSQRRIKPKRGRRKQARPNLNTA